MEESLPPAVQPVAPQLRFGKIDDLTSRVAAATDARAPPALFRSSTKTATGAVNSKPTPRSRPTTSFCTRMLGTVDAGRFAKAARYILQHQNEDGGWSIYEGGPSNVSASVKVYFGLKLAGYSASIRRCSGRAPRFLSLAA